MTKGGGEEQATGAHTGAPDVFISYASQDAALADSIVAVLESEGFNCWIAPRDVTPGTHYASAIVHAIDAAKVIVLVLSQSAASSPHVLREVERATSKRHPVVSLRIDQAPLPAEFEYFLNTSQWLTPTAGDPTSAMPKLIAAVNLSINKPATPDDVIAATPAVATGSREPDHLGRDKAQRRITIAIAALVAVAIAGFAAYRSWQPAPPAISPRAAALAPATHTALSATATIPEKSVAVLPFVDMSQKKDQEYFTDGLSEELIDKLAHSIDLKVIARTSSFQFKGKNEDIRMIGQKLGVANLLEGSVRTSGKTLRVTAQLIKVADGSHLWSETYDRDSRDIFKVQDEISRSVVAALQATMAAGQVPSRDNPGGNMAAYNAYLRGRYFYNKLTEGDSRRSIAEYEEAIRLEPRYAAAWVGLAGAYNVRGLLGWMPPKEAYAQARKAADTALQINPNLAYVHAMLAAILMNYTFDFDAMTAENRRRHELDPSDAGAAGDQGVTALSYGHTDDAVRLLRLETERNPLGMYQWFNFAIALWSADRLKEAEAAARNLVALDPAFSGAHCLLGKVLLAQGQSAAALAAMMEEQDQISRTSCVANAYWVLGRRREADAMLAEIQAKYSESRAISLAESYASRGEKDEAFKWLMRAYENREPWVIEIKSDPLLRNLRGDPRFTALLHKMKLPE